MKNQRCGFLVVFQSLISALVLSGLAAVPYARADAFRVTGSMNTARWFSTLTILPNGKILVAGGADASFNTFASAELFDPATGIWTATGSMNTPRYSHTATLLQNGKVLVSGGQNSSGTTNSAELYDPVSGTWSYTGSLSSNRVEHTATLLPDGQVLVCGG